MRRKPALWRDGMTAAKDPSAGHKRTAQGNKSQRIRDAEYEAATILRADGGDDAAAGRGACSKHQLHRPTAPRFQLVSGCESSRQARSVASERRRDARFRRAV